MQSHTWPSCKIQTIWCERSQRNNKVLNVLLIQIQIHFAVAFSGNAALIALRLVLWPPCPRTICFSFTYLFKLCLFPCDRYTIIISLTATAANSGSFAYFLVHLRFAYFPILLLFRPGSFRSLSCSPRIISDHCRNPCSCCFAQQ